MKFGKYMRSAYIPADHKINPPHGIGFIICVQPGVTMKRNVCDIAK